MDIYEAINAVGKDDIVEILDHVLFCYEQLFPQYSVSVLSINKHEDKVQQIDETIALLQKLKEEPSLQKLHIIKS